MSKTKQKADADPLVPSKSPLAYNVGVNYESWEVGRVGYSISADLDQISQNFKLVRTYHDAAVGTSDPTTPSMDPTRNAPDGGANAPGSATELLPASNPPWKRRLNSS